MITAIPAEINSLRGGTRCAAKFLVSLGGVSAPTTWLRGIIRSTLSAGVNIGSSCLVVGNGDD